MTLNMTPTDKVRIACTILIMVPDKMTNRLTTTRRKDVTETIM
jgi:hypothetical protein